ncbi:zeta toxin family protein [Streptomyces sp. NPDC059218]|uniref:zeta toxin family protein n=1 Tax=unclassified Streptomyces TaxID=2593676 RepID=UPI0036B5FFC9
MVVFVAGQPGAGKTEIADLVQAALGAGLRSRVAVGGDVLQDRGEGVRLRALRGRVCAGTFGGVLVKRLAGARAGAALAVGIRLPGVSKSW